MVVQHWQRSIRVISTQAVWQQLNMRKLDLFLLRICLLSAFSSHVRPDSHRLIATGRDYDGISLMWPLTNSGHYILRRS